jgi:hypothetical protein
MSLETFIGQCLSQQSLVDLLKLDKLNNFYYNYNSLNTLNERQNDFCTNITENRMIN